MTTTPDAPPQSGFAALGLDPALVKAVTALGYEEATPIQRAAIPVLLTGRDILGQAGTGTGKTAAFALPLLHRLLHVPASKRGALRALVLVPTRGRALDHLRRKTLDLSVLDVLVLDEADEMLDMGFADDLEAMLTSTPETRQTALFAATMAPRIASMAPRIASIAERHLRAPERITVRAEKRAPGKLPQVRQAAYIVSRSQKDFALGRILEFEDPTVSGVPRRHWSSAPRPAPRGVGVICPVAGGRVFYVSRRTGPITPIPLPPQP